MDWLDIACLVCAILSAFGSGYWLAKGNYTWASLDAVLTIWNFLAAFI